MLVGIVTEGDLIFRDADIKAPGFLDILGGIIPLGNWEEYREETLKSAGVTVAEVMTKEVTTVTPDTPLAEAANLRPGQLRQFANLGLRTVADVLHAADQWAQEPATVEEILDAQDWARDRARSAVNREVVASR